MKVSERSEFLRTGGGGAVTYLTCGVVRVDHVASERLVAQLPPLLLVDSWDAVTDGWLQSTLRFIAQETQHTRFGGETILTHLADILVIQAIRAWLETAPEAQQGWLAAARDPQIGKALTAIHQQPGAAWSVANLARHVGMSRSGFSARFTELVGDSVKSYLTQWRMALAKKRLASASVPLIQVAEEFGYGSEAAFSRAFKRVFGVSPGKIESK